jgi:hypothetical protein
VIDICLSLHKKQLEGVPHLPRGSSKRPNTRSDGSKTNGAQTHQEVEVSAYQQQINVLERANS